MNIYNDGPASLRKGPVLLNVCFEKAWKCRINASTTTVEVVIVAFRRAGLRSYSFSLPLLSQAGCSASLGFCFAHVKSGLAS